MASRLFDAISNKGNYNIGALNSKWTKHMVNGAILDSDKVENYTLVEIFYDEDGELHAKQLTDPKKKGYLVTTVEEDQLLEGEEYVDFYNAKGEIIRITDVDEQKNSRFETSAISLNEGGVGSGGSKVASIKNGMVAHFDPTSKTYVVSDKASPATAYDTAINKFEVVDSDTDLGYAFDKPTIRLMSI